MTGLHQGRTDAPGTGAVRCVIVDDNDRFIELARPVLARGGFEVVGVARNTAQALRLVAEARPDVAFVDLFIDHESGIDLVEEIARMGLAERMRIILVSICHPDDLHAVCQTSAADGYLFKLELSPGAVRDILHSDDGSDLSGRRTG